MANIALAAGPKLISFTAYKLGYTIIMILTLNGKELKDENRGTSTEH